IYLWENPPYIDYTNNNFRPSITEFKVNDTKTAVIVCPGGGYGGKAEHERTPIAKMFNAGGINAFTLDYNVAPCHKFAPLSDLLRAIRVVRSMGYEKVATLGFSAGGHLCCTSGTLYDFDAYPKTDEIDNYSARPDAFMPCYAVVSFGEFTHMGSRENLLSSEKDDEALVELFSNEKHINKDTPPCFIWHTANDNAVPVENSLMLASELAKNKVYFEAHIYPNGWHGLGLAEDRNDISMWSKNAVIFLKNLGF
ncbi:MAG: alpha/beta hydrolase, partial [Clostridia bacterium]|nr:alpha/beta hydrolase [Clostridia bacterium]